MIRDTSVMDLYLYFTYAIMASVIGSRLKMNEIVFVIREYLRPVRFSSDCSHAWLKRCDDIKVNI